MNNFVKTFTTPDGDVYEIVLSEERSILSVDVLNQMDGIVVVGIDLRRLYGANVTMMRILAALERI